ncbi:unnamed protein product [Angiostrongylus costaricensis]|uniref:Kin17_mid domain-containing protein n=1 Tax=Angiostrongylus costaricensis TaxID=334426 RepID=A0A158PE98_ANGCS|nr:unnamed protein product [Angiostrongylus costaricensis]
MGKHERGTPKDIANRIKSKGLQKLRWFCQMCQKQCRDQNGFKCHLTSESHQRQLLLVAENTGTYLRQFSKQFEANFMQILKTCFGTKRVRANEVYQEYIKDKGHVHMNSTVWHTLTGFVHYLGSSGKCRIDQNEKEEVLRKAEEAKRIKAEKDDEERQQEMINERQNEIVENQPSELVRNDDSEKIVLNLNFDKKPTLETKKEEVESDAETSYSRRKAQEREDSKHDRKDRHMNRTREERSRSRTLDEIREHQERSKEKKNRKDHWLHEGIIVKVITKKLGEKYYKSKGVVMTLIDDYVASVKLGDGVLIKLDQSHVETVIPSVGRKMKIVNGAYRGCTAKLESLDTDNFSLNLRIVEGPMNGRRMTIDDPVIKGALKLKKGDFFKKKKKKAVDPKMIDLTIKKDENGSTAGKTKAEISFEKRRQETMVSLFLPNQECGDSHYRPMLFLQ